MCILSFPLPYLSSSCGYVNIHKYFPNFLPTQSFGLLLNSKLDPFSSMAASTATKLTTALLFSSFTTFHQNPSVIISFKRHSNSWSKPIRRVACKATDVSNVGQDKAETTVMDDAKKWVPVVPIAALPRGERRVIIQEDETIMLLWYKDEVFAIENRSPAEGAYSEGLLNAKLTQDGCIVCPTTDSTFDLRTGKIKEWYPKNPVLRVLTPALRKLFVYPVKLDGENIYLGMFGDGNSSGASAEIVFSGKTQPGFTASDVNIEEVRMIVDEGSTGFGFTPRNELINGKAAIIGFLLLIDFELLTGKGLLKGTGFLDFIYAASNNSL